jgi:hypothetical protein
MNYKVARSITLEYRGKEYMVESRSKVVSNSFLEPGNVVQSKALQLFSGSSAICILAMVNTIAPVIDHKARP